MSKGKEKLEESLSALMDNEASEFEFRRFLKQCESNGDLKHKWERFHLLSSIIRGELDASDNASKSILNAKAGATSERPDLLSRINAELDGYEGNASSAASSDNVDSNNPASWNHTGTFKRLGQGAIAASVAAVVFIGSGSLSPLMLQETEMQLAEQSEIAEDMVPDFDDAYSPSEFSRIPLLNTEIAGTESVDEAARVRLRQAVFQEFVGEPQESLELPVNFNVIIEEE